MVKHREVIQSITRIKPVDEAANQTTVVKYDSDGKPDKTRKSKISDQQSCAIEITVGKNKFYKIKAKRDGKLFNPSKKGMLYSLDVIDRISNSPMFQFKEVSQKAFDYYVAFLNKREDSMLTVAEREAFNG